MKYSAPAKENHWALWNWLAENPGARKQDWPGWETMDRLSIEPPPAHCFLCAAFDEDAGCHDCPLMVGGCVCHKGGIYPEWTQSFDPARRTALAIQIRDAWK